MKNIFTKKRMLQPRNFLLQIVALLIVNLFSSCDNNPYSFPKDKNILFSSISEDPKTLDPAEVGDSLSHHIAGQIHAVPFQYKYLKRPLELEPGLSEDLGKWGKHPGIGPLGEAKYELKGKNTFTIKFKKGINFQNDICFDSEKNDSLTREIIAKDYAYSIKRQADPNSKAKGTFLIRGLLYGLEEFSEKIRKETKDGSKSNLNQNLKGLEILDRYTIRLTLTKESKILKYFFTNIFSSPTPAECVDYYDGSSISRPHFRRHPIASGAYRLKAWREGHSIHLVKNENYRNEPYPNEGSLGDKKLGLLADTGQMLPLIEDLYFLIIKQTIPKWLLFEQGYQDGAGIPRDVFGQVVFQNNLTQKYKDRNIRLTISPELVSYYFVFNMEDKKIGGFSKEAKLLRQALSLALDRKLYIDTLRNGRGIIAHSPIPPGIDGYRPEYKNPWVEFNPKKAKNLLEEAGYPAGIDPETARPLEIRYMMVAHPSLIDDGRFYQKCFERIGIKLVIDTYDWATLTKKLRSAKFQISQGGWMADYPEAENFMQLLFSKNIGDTATNSARYNNLVFDKLYLKLYKAKNAVEKSEIVAQIMEVLNEDMPWLFTFHPTTFGLFHHWYLNNKDHPLGHGLARYKRIDTKKRADYQKVYNKPMYIVLFGMALIILIIIFFTMREKKKLK